MPELSPKAEARELLLGTWIGVALIVELLVERFDLPREELLLKLSEAQAAAKPGKSTALAGMRLLIERGFG